MLQKRRSKSPKVYAVFAFLLAFPLTQLEAATLKGRADQNGHKESTEVTSGYKSGVFEFGKGFKRSEDDSDYQADQGWYGQQQQQFNSMSPTVACGPNDMKITAHGELAKYFSMNQMSPSCGSNIWWNPFGLAARIPYDGCNVEISDGYYNFPLVWNNMPVTAKCPHLSPIVDPFTPFPFPFPTQEPPVPPTPFPFPWFPFGGLPHYHVYPKLPPGFPHPYPWLPQIPTPSPQSPAFPQFPGYYPKYPLPQSPIPSQNPLSKYYWLHKLSHKYPQYPGQTVPHPSLPSQNYYQHLKYPTVPQYPYGKPWSTTASP